MKKIHVVIPYLFLLSAFFFVSRSATAQGNVLELLPGAEKLGYDSKTGAHRLVGSVNFIYQGNTMYCDSAHYFSKTNEVRAYGNVHITKNEINLFCDSLYYNGNTKQSKLWGHVRVRDLEYKLTTDSMDYDVKKELGVYRYGGKVESITSEEVLTSRVGYFYPRIKSFFFSGKVKYKNKELSMSTDTLKYIYEKQTTYFYGPTTIKRGKTTMLCERGWYNVKTQEGSLIKHAEILEKGRHIKGDTLLYQPQLGLSIGRGHVYFKDTSQAIVFYGDYAKNSDKEHYSFLTGHALAVKVQKKDTIYIEADTLYNQNDTLGKSLYSLAYNKVKVFNTSVQAIADSVHFSSSMNKMALYKKPIVWSKNAELKGDQMDIFLNDTLVERVEINQHATVLMEIDSGNYYNQLAGKKITSYFYQNELVRSHIEGNARTVFFPQEEQKTDTNFVVKRIGMNRLYASELKIYLDSGEIRGITYFDKPDGVFYPMDKIKKEEQFIAEFEWKAALRPKKPFGRVGGK